MPHKTTTRSLAEFLEGAYLAHNLHMLQMTAQLIHLEYTAAVDIFVREIVQQIIQGTYVQFPGKKSGTLFANTRKIFYISCCGVQHSIRVFATIISNGVVSFMFSRLPLTATTCIPAASTTEASSVNSSTKRCS